MRGMLCRAGPLLLAAVTVLACGERSTISAPASTTLRSEDLVGEAAAGLDASGRFVLKNRRTTARPEISETQAVALASAYIADYGPFFLRRFQLQHKSAINLSALKPCGRVYYAATAYEAVLTNMSKPLQRVAGPHWLVTLCSADGQPTISVGVSALAMDVQLTTGVNRLLHPGANNFFACGIPPRLLELPASPEAAARMVMKATGRRVSTVPELVMPEPPYVAQLARWKMTLEAPIAVRGVKSGFLSTTRNVLVGFAGGWETPSLLVAAPETSQPPTFIDRGVRNMASTVTLTRSRPEIPATTEAFTMENRR